MCSLVCSSRLQHLRSLHLLLTWRNHEMGLSETTRLDCARTLCDTGTKMKLSHCISQNMPLGKLRVLLILCSLGVYF